MKPFISIVHCTSHRADCSAVEEATFCQDWPVGLASCPRELQQYRQGLPPSLYRQYTSLTVGSCDVHTRFQIFSTMGVISNIFVVFSIILLSDWTVPKVHLTWQNPKQQESNKVLIQVHCEEQVIDVDIDVEEIGIDVDNSEDFSDEVEVEEVARSNQEL